MNKIQYGQFFTEKDELIESIEKSYKIEENNVTNEFYLCNLFNSLNENSETGNRDDITTPMECVKKMIDYIPEEFWFRNHIRILDPCCGNGNFGAYCSLKTNIDNIYFNEINYDRYKMCKKILNPKNITNDDAFNIFNSNEKFDLIMANPPYSGGGNKNQSLSNKFIEASIDILNENGYLCYVTPNNWMTYNNHNKILKKLLENGEFIVIDNDCKKYFSSVGSSFTILIWQKTKIKKTTFVNNNYLIKDTQFVNIPKDAIFIPLYLSQEMFSIIKKSFSKERNVFNYRCDLHNFTKKENLRDVKDEKFKYETIHTIKKMRYANIKQNIYDKWIIVVPLSTYFIPFIEHNKNTTQSVGYIQFNSKKEATEFLTKLQKKYIKVLIHITRFGNFNNIKVLKHIIFNEPKFTKKEFNLIETLAKKIKY